MLLVLVGNATSSTSLVTEQEGLTWLHASTRARTHANARTQVRNTYARTRGVSRTTRSVSYLELKPLKCAVVFCTILLPAATNIAALNSTHYEKEDVGLSAILRVSTISYLLFFLHSL